MRGDSNRDDDAAAPAGTQRLDKWLWFARIVKSRTLAAQLVAEGKVRVNRTRVSKPAQAVRSADVLTIALRGQVRVLRILAPGVRRGPPSEAQRLYEVLETGAPSPTGDASVQHTQAARTAKRSGRPPRRLPEKG
ncbi:MAG: RNA-binding S4 domain-containing protein [Hyphomicrobiaceae bacterium]